MDITPFLDIDFQGVIRQQAEDFRVDEIPAVEPDGEGEHLWLKIRKRNTNTDRVAGWLAQSCGVPRRDVSFAGLKDRHAVTSQWFSVHLPGKAVGDIAASLPEEVSILEQIRHSRKLRRGALRGNRFVLTLRDCQGDVTAFTNAIDEIAQTGMPNYFGEQRFGFKGGNLEKARNWFAGEFRPKKKHLKSLYLSAARSLIFNRILEQRVKAGNWDQALPGDVFMLDGSHSWFTDDGEADVKQRLQHFDIHPAGALWGRGELPTQGEALAVEQRIAAMEEEFCAGLEQQGLKQDRRALRVRPEQVDLQQLDMNSWQLSFTLPAGSYATVLLAQCGKFREADRT